MYGPIRSSRLNISNLIIDYPIIISIALFSILVIELYLWRDIKSESTFSKVIKWIVKKLHLPLILIKRLVTAKSFHIAASVLIPSWLYVTHVFQEGYNEEQTALFIFFIYWCLFFIVIGLYRGFMALKRIYQKNENDQLEHNTKSLKEATSPVENEYVHEELKRSNTQVSPPDSLEPQNKNQAKGKIYHVLQYVIVFVVLIGIAGIAGKYRGRSAAVKHAYQETASQGMPTGLLGAKWLMPISEVKRKIPDAYKTYHGGLKVERVVYERQAYVDYIFKDQLLMQIIVSFKGDRTKKTFNATQKILTEKYGPFPKPKSDDSTILFSRKQIGRIVISHELYSNMAIKVEQVNMFRTKLD